MIHSKLALRYMHFNFKIEVDLLDFCKSGKFDLLKIGMSKQELLDNFPEPDGVGLLNKKLKMEIWRYGNFDLHLTDNKLESIYTDWIENVQGGEKLIIHTWIFTPENDLSLLGVLKELNNHKIDYEKNTNTIGQITLKLLPSRVELVFDMDRTMTENSKAVSPNIFPLVAMMKR